MTDIRIKRGESLHLQLYYSDSGTGQAIDLTNATLTAQLRAPDDSLVATMTVVKTATIGVARIDQAVTSGWPLGMLRCDVKQLAAGFAASTQTFAVYVDREVTRV